MPLVSVIIPVFNGAEYIAAAIDSVLSQDYKSLEVLVVDDGSTDQTKSVVLQYTQSGRVRYFYQENRERSAARNLGLSQARGRYIQYLDADDELLPNKISSQVYFLESHADCCAVYGAAVFFGDTSSLKSKRLFKDYGNKFLEEMVISNFIPINALLFRKSELLRFDEKIRLLEDWKMLLGIAMAGNNIAAMDQDVCKIRLHSGNSSSNREEMARGELVVLEWVGNTFVLNRTLSRAWSHAQFIRRLELHDRLAALYGLIAFLRFGSNTYRTPLFTLKRLAKYVKGIFVVPR